ncbi:MAG: type II toxin-antitoxin system HipA family toxin [Lentisphaerae bacterium]|nr:type II toxin-antitoxin system HipA family toxin [Lentisphaerota bacterium]
MGLLSADRNRGKEVFSFAYDDAWLSGGVAQQLDPDLALFEGRHYLREGRPNFGLFLDSSPDRWGRLLMRRREACYARREGRLERPLSELDYLLGVYDGQRMGALRFQEDGRSGFLNSDEHLATPPLTSLRELEHASLMFEADETGRDDDALKWINQLLAPGSSLGGARPKAGVVDDQGSLWIAKFPSRRDGVDVGAWEAVVNELARLSGLRVPEGKLQRLTQRRHTYLSRRFDRLPTGGRIHFASAMTLLGYADGTDAASGVSYLELAEFIMRNGVAVAEDLAELWRRIVFNICVSNTDDHLRNHGFLLAPNEGWTLAPAYDMNPNPQGSGLTLNIAGNDNRLDLALAMEVTDSFRLPLSDAQAQMAAIRVAVGRWRQVAAHKRISKAEQDEMAPAFQRA